MVQGIRLYGWSALAWIIALAGDDVVRMLRYERQALGAWPTWRIFTAHFVHLGAVHLVPNITGLALSGC